MVQGSKEGLAKYENCHEAMESRGLRKRSRRSRDEEPTSGTMTVKRSKGARSCIRGQDGQEAMAYITNQDGRGQRVKGLHKEIKTVKMSWVIQQNKTVKTVRNC